MVVYYLIAGNEQLSGIASHCTNRDADQIDLCNDLK